MTTKSSATLSSWLQNAKVEDDQDYQKAQQELDTAKAEEEAAADDLKKSVGDQKSKVIYGPGFFASLISLCNGEYHDIRCKQDWKPATAAVKE